MASAEPIDNRLFILILQHPREKKEALATAAATRALLHRAELVVGLSWPNLARALGRSVDGVVVLDGTWKEAKTLWWRNPWLLKLHRLVLNPPRKSRYGRVRREPRREALSTIEAVGLLMKHLDGGPETEARLLGALDRLLAGDDPSDQPAERVSR